MFKNKQLIISVALCKVINNTCSILKFETSSDLLENYLGPVNSCCCSRCVVVYSYVMRSCLQLNDIFICANISGTIRLLVWVLLAVQLFYCLYVPLYSCLL